MTTTQWEIVDDCGVQVSISDAARAAYSADRERQAEDQRLSRVDRLYTEIKLGALSGALLTIAGLVLKQLIGG